jgi:hypothetical protein
MGAVLSYEIGQTSTWRQIQEDSLHSVSPHCENLKLSAEKFISLKIAYFLTKSAHFLCAYFGMRAFLPHCLVKMDTELFYFKDIKRIFLFSDATLYFNQQLIKSGFIPQYA